MVDVYKFLKRNANLELVWNNKGRQVVFKSSILYVFDDRIYLSRPQNDTENFESVNVYEKMQVVICTEEGVLSGNANLVEKNSNEEGNVFISFPYNTQFCQRRENARVPMHAEFDLYIEENQTLHLTTKNVSGKGLACITNEPLPDFADKRLVLHLQGRDIEIAARKVYSQKMEIPESELYLNGIEFTEISQDDVAIILKVCLKFQMNSKHNERLFETL